MLATAIRKLSFVRSIEKNRSDDIFIIRAKDAFGKQAWYYLLADAGKRDAFKAKCGAPFVKLTDFGEILHCGFGDEPPEELKLQMYQEYGFKEQKAA